MSVNRVADRAGVYLRPGGLLGGGAGQQAVRQGKAGLIGAGWAAFCLVEIIERTGNNIQRSWHSYGDIAETGDKAIADTLRRVEAPRSPVAGLPMSEPQIMGIVNVTPDSFSDGGDFLQSKTAIAHGKELQAAGADVLDIGGESTRPGADYVSEEEEAKRVVPVLKGLQGLGVALSVDTRKPSVMRHGAAAGAGFVNDVTALSFSEDSLKTVGELGVPVCLMHSQGTPQTMQDNPQYDDVVLDVYDYLGERIAVCVEAGIAVDQIVVDPGIGFGKTVRHNLALIDEISVFHGLGVPVLLGASRKSFIAAVTGNADVDNRLSGSLAVALCGVAAGVQFLRVHDVAETVQALRVWQASENSPQF